VKQLFARVLALVIAFAVTSGLGVPVRAETNDGFFELTILHINDHHSHLDSQVFDLRLPFDPDLENPVVRLRLGGMSFIHSLIEEHRDENSLFLSSGELHGTLFYSMFGRGEADFKVFNVLNPDAYMPGNHEFNEGDEHFAYLMGLAEFPILSGNIVPTEMSPLYGILGDKPYIIKEVGGHQIAVIGVLKIEKTVRSSMISEYVDFIDEIEFVQSQVEHLTEQGINKIIVLSHLGYEFDIELAQSVAGINVIAGGDTHNLLDSTGEMETLQLPVGGGFPTVVEAPDGRNVYIIQAWEYSKGLGILNVTFDQNGDIVEASGRTILPVGGPFLVRDEENQWVPAEDETLDAIMDAIDSFEVLVHGVNSAAIDEIIDPMIEIIEQTMMERIGSIAVTLPNDRVPEPFEVGETPNGSFAAQIVADSFLKYVPFADIAIQNAGGVRTPLMEGDFTMADVLTILPFANTIAIITLPGSEIIAVLDEAIRFSQGIAQSTGAFPYASALRFDVYLDAPEGVRSAFNVEVMNRETGEWAPIDPDKYYTVVTNSFTVMGRDNYLAFERAIYNDPQSMINLHVQYAVPLIELIRSLEAEGRMVEFDVENFSIRSVREWRD